jgi:hypothetical protein
MRYMSSWRVLIGIVAVAMCSFASAVWSTMNAWDQPVDGTTAVFERLGHHPLRGAGRATSPARVDRYGNPVEPAVGEYRFDLNGEMYERHSPQTALPSLGRPEA